jgi:hypothetical protein
MCSSDFLCECEYKANSSQQMDYEIRLHDLGNLPRNYYYVKNVLQFVRLVINIGVNERVYSVFENKVHIILVQRDAWYMRGVSYAILTLGNSCSVLLLVKAFDYSRMLAYMTSCGTCKTKKMTQRNSYTTQPKHSPYSWNFVRDYNTTPCILDESGKNFRLIFEKI